MREQSQIICFQNLSALSQYCSCTDFKTMQNCTSWNANSIVMKHYELLSLQWTCRNKGCQHVNSISIDTCMNCHKLRRSTRK